MSEKYLFSSNQCLYPHHGSIQHYAKSSVTLSLCLLLCFRIPLPAYTFVSPPPFYKLSNFCKSVLVVTFTVEMVRIEGLKKNDAYSGTIEERRKKKKSSVDR